MGCRVAPSAAPTRRTRIPGGRRCASSPDAVQEQAASVLRRCVPPNANAGQETGLVVGYIQSGKTMSFTTAAALARDNGYAVVIVIAGTSIPLTEQSRQRLRHDLGIDQRDDRSVGSDQLERVGQNQSERNERNVDHAKIDKLRDVFA